MTNNNEIELIPEISVYDVGKDDDRTPAPGHMPSGPETPTNGRPVSETISRPFQFGWGY